MRKIIKRLFPFAYDDQAKMYGEANEAPIITVCKPSEGNPVKEPHSANYVIDIDLCLVSDAGRWQLPITQEVARLITYTSRPSFPERIRAMNEKYDLPVNDSPIDRGVDRLHDLFQILLEELEELNDIYAETIALQSRGDGSGYDVVECLVKLADLLGDFTVYVRSEAESWGIPLDEVLDIIMDSNESKLGEDDQPIKDSRGKFQKGPNFVPPEPRIRELILSRMEKIEAHD